MAGYTTERDGQIDFFKNYGIPYDEDGSILADHTDGVWNGNILEFKLSISNLNKVLLQAVKYLSHMRVKGEDIPASIILVDLNTEKAYLYRSEDYRDAIHRIYTGSASKDNGGFAAGKPHAVYDYSKSNPQYMADSAALKRQLTGNKTLAEKIIPVDIDEDCIVGWAERYYREVPNATKGDFLGDETGNAVSVTGEIRCPRHFAGHINPYTGKSNEKFMYLMDCLNDRLSKKDLGAFYTPMPYARKAAELVEMAVNRALEAGKKDYIILDRCAGTGNLEDALVGLYDMNGNELISHSIVSTYEYYEYKVLNERIGDKVRDIIPPTEADVVYENGKVSNADAMSEDYINNPIIKAYLNDEDCAVILFENPPYFDCSSITYTEGSDKTVRNTTHTKESYICKEFKKNILDFGSVQATARELSNLFIWSAKRFYLRQSSDSYIVFSPVKYFKNIELLKLKCGKGFAFNRRHFHATDSVISCMLWFNEECNDESWTLDIYDIENDSLKNMDSIITIRVAHESVAKFNDKRIDPSDIDSDVVCNSDGTECIGWSYKDKHSKYNPNIVCYMAVTGFIPDVKHRYLTRCGKRSGIEQSYGFMVRKDNYLEKLPMWVSKMYPMDLWFEKDVYYNTADGGNSYTRDKGFLKSCLIYTCLSNQNKCLTFEGSDGRHYQNELCFDTGTIASADLTGMKLDDEEKELLKLWKTILDEARATGKCRQDWTYGVYQITKEINTFRTVGTGKAKKNVYDYPKLNGDLDTLRVKLKEYYKSHITEKMFEYQLVK